MNVREFKELYPQYKGLSDDTLARKLHAKFYPDIDYNIFASRFGVRPTIAQQVRPIAKELAIIQKRVAKLPPELTPTPEWGVIDPTDIPLPEQPPLTPHRIYIEDLKKIYREPGTPEQREEKARKRTRQRLDERISEIQIAQQKIYDRRRWQEEQEKIKDSFLKRTYRRWERGEIMVVGGALYLAEEISRLATLGKYGNTVEEWARLMHRALQEPEMQPVIENVFDKYFGGAIETGPFLGAAIGTAALSGGATIPSSIGGFLVAYSVEGNNIYQTALDQGKSERSARIRGIVGGTINGGLEVLGGAGGKYFKDATIRNVVTRTGKAKYFSKRVLHTALAEGLKEELPQEAVAIVLGADSPRKPDGSIDYYAVAGRLVDAAVMGTILGGAIDVPFSAYGLSTLPSIERGTAVDVGAGRIALPGMVYEEAKIKSLESGSAVNPWVKQDITKSNKDRTLMIQFASDLITKKEEPLAKAYYDKLYSKRPGYYKLGDTWEIPKWMAEVNNTIPKSDVYFVRDMAEAKEFLNKSGYSHITFSALDANKDVIRELAKDFKGEVSIGGYTDLTFFDDLDNVKTYNTVQAMAEGRGHEYKPGVNYNHFENSKSIPRLCMSTGCLHKCAFCVAPKDITEMTPELINNQADKIAKMDAQLVYIDDKTFGQVKNYKYLIDVYDRIKGKNPGFEGFIIQTTAADIQKLDNQFLKDAGVKFIEIGVESYNDNILKSIHKPANERLINEAAEKARKAGINLIPNVMIGLPQETSDTYANTLAWLKNNQDVISHMNIYNLALYEGTELAAEIGVKDAADINENQVKKSFHKDPELHTAMAAELYNLGSKILDTPLIEETILPYTVDEAVGAQYGFTPLQVRDILAKAEDRYRLLKNKDVAKRSWKDKKELTFLKNNRSDIEALIGDITSDKPLVRNLWKKPKKPPKKELLRKGHEIPEQMGMVDEDRRDLQEQVTGKRSMVEMSKDEMVKWVNYLEADLAAKGETYIPRVPILPQLIDSLKAKAKAKIPSGRIVSFLKSKLTHPYTEFLRIERWLESLDGYKDGPMRELFWKRVKRADELRNVNIFQARDDFLRMVEEQNIDSTLLLGKKINIRKGLKLTSFERIGVYLLAQNKQGFKYLTKGMAITEEDIKLIEDTLSEEELSIAAWLDEQYRAQWPIIRAVALDVGIDPKILEQELNYSPILRIDDPYDVDFTTLLTEQFNRQSVQPEQGFLEKRKERAVGKIELDAGVIFMRNIQRIESFKTMAPLAKKFNSILANPEFKSALNAATEGLGSKILSTYLRDTIRGYIPGPQTWLEKAISIMRRNGIIYAIGWNIPSALRQTLSMSNAMAVDPLMFKYIPANLFKSMATGGYENIESFVEERSALVRTREYDRDLRKKWDASKLGKRLVGKMPFDEKATRWIKWMDKHTVVIAWKSLYDTALEKGMNESAAIEFADKWIARTQPMANMKDLPNFFRGGPIARLLSTFQNQVNNNFNFYVHDIVGTTIARKLNAEQVAWRVMWSWVVPATLFGIIGRGSLPIDEEGINWKKIAVDLSTYPIATLMLIGRFINRMIRGWGNAGTVAEIAPEEAVRMVQAAKRGDVKGMIRHAAATVGALTGRIPAQAIRTTMGTMDLIAGTTKDPRRLIYTKWALEQEERKKPIKRIRGPATRRSRRGGPARGPR